MRGKYNRVALAIALAFSALAVVTPWGTPGGIDEARREIARVQAWDIAKNADLHASQTATTSPRSTTSSKRRPTRATSPLDPWQRPYRSAFDSRALTVCSDGPDRTAATADDVCVTTSSTVRRPRAR